MHLKIPDGSTLEWAAKEMLRCLVNIRYWENKVANEGGRECRLALKNWQERTDSLLKQLEAFKTTNYHEQVVILKPETNE